MIYVTDHRATDSRWADVCYPLFRAMRLRCAQCLPLPFQHAHLAWPSGCQMNSEPGAVRKWKLADISRVLVDGVEVDIKRRANEFVREDGQPVQLVLEFREDLLSANARQTARRSHARSSASPRSSLA